MELYDQAALGECLMFLKCGVILLQALSMLDQGGRTADLITGPQGATVLALDRERLLALREDDPELGSLLLWNIAKAMSGRVRFILWQLQRTYQRARVDEKQRQAKS